MRIRKYLTILMLIVGLAATAQTWIWYSGDFEIWLGNRMNNNRTERGAFFPPFWKTDSHYVTVEFSKEIDLPNDEEIEIHAEGRYNVKLDGKLQFGAPQRLNIPAGTHQLNIKVWNQSTPPSIYVKGNTINSDSSWKVTNEDKEWIDESGKASDTSATEYAQAGYWNFDDSHFPPSTYSLKTEPREKAGAERIDNGGTLYDFGTETFGRIVLKNTQGNGIVNIYYGESPQEALDINYCETLDKIEFSDDIVTDLATGSLQKRSRDYELDNTKAFRYVYAVPEKGVEVEDISMQYEYAPLEYKGSFRCSDPEINRIWDVGAYTMHLTTREFFIDGIKRDRWVWSGDAVQSYLMNYYLFFDSPTVKRTTRLLRGKDPITAHINTIMDYTLYWFNGIYDYYLYSGDKEFIDEIYPKMQTMMEYVLNRTNKGGMLEGMTGDWVFVDWADFPMSKVTAEHAGEPDRNGQFKIISRTEITGPNDICTDSYLIIGASDDYQQVLNTYKYIQTRFMRFLVMLAVSSINLSSEKFQFVPLQDFTDESDIDWSNSIAEIDGQLYAKYGLTEEEIAFIESMIKPM